MTRLLALALFALLTGCAGVQAPPASQNDQLRGNPGHDWTLEGKAAIRSGESSNTAYIDWQQQGERFKIIVSGPLGQGGARIEGGPGLVSLSLPGEEQPLTGPNPESVMQQALGWHLPVSQASYWVTGRPAPDLPSQPLSSGGPGFEQQGWQVGILRLTDISDQLTLPSRLDFRYADIRIRLVIGHWSLEPQKTPPE